jgi:hypothetical protein
VADEDSVTLRSPEGEVREVGSIAVPFFTNQGYVVLTKDGRVNAKATSAASDNTKEN